MKRNSTARVSLPVSLPQVSRMGAAALHVAPLTPATGTWIVTPEVASAWLARNTTNRRMSPWRVQNLAAEIVGGRWMLTHQGVAFGASGALLDGQHRLAAIVASDTPCAMPVVCGLDDAARNVIDTGRARSAADTLTLLGHSYSTLVASICSIESQVQAKVARTVTSNARMAEMVAENPDIHDAAEAVSKRKTALAGWMPQSVIGWWYWRAARVAPDKALEFLDAIAYGEGLTMGSPALAIRNRFSAVFRSTAPRATRPDAIYMLCSAWAAFCAGRTLVKSQLPKPGNSLEKLAGPGMQ